MNQETAARPLQHVLLTGAASGIGAECARKLRARGIQITALDIAEPATAVDHFCKLDLADATSIEQAVAFALANGPFDALLNIAGIPPRPDQELKVLARPAATHRRCAEWAECRWCYRQYGIKGGCTVA